MHRNDGQMPSQPGRRLFTFKRAFFLTAPPLVRLPVRGVDPFFQSGRPLVWEEHYGCDADAQADRRSSGLTRW